jgi:AmmeMemoRadiSam system protein A
MSVVGAFAVPHPPLILPEVGKGQERQIQKTIDSFRHISIEISKLAPDTIVIASPHSACYLDYFHISPGTRAAGDMRQFGARRTAVEAEYDTAFVTALSEACSEAGIPAGARGERDASLDHATFIPVWFVQEVYQNFKLVRIGLSGLSPMEHYALGKCVAATAEQLSRRVVFVASGDLSHRLKADGPYGFAPEGPEFDREVTSALGSGDFLKLLEMPETLSEGAGECGLRAFQIMAGALDGLAVESTLLSYEGPFGVGYGVASFAVTGNDPDRRFDKKYKERQKAEQGKTQAEEDEYVRLARYSLEQYVKTGRRAKLPDVLPEGLAKRRAGAFVSLKKNGRLRGCIGTISPAKDSLAEEILRNAVSAGTEDPRFDPVTEPELPDLVYSVDVLSPPESISSEAELDVKRYGVIVTKGFRRGLLLPNLEGIDTVREQVDIAKRKAGIRQDESVSLERFEVVRHT